MGETSFEYTHQVQVQHFLSFVVNDRRINVVSCGFVLNRYHCIGIVSLRNAKAGQLEVGI